MALVVVSVDVAVSVLAAVAVRYSASSMETPPARLLIEELGRKHGNARSAVGRIPQVPWGK